MAGFAKFTFVGEHMTNSIVNVLWYRSTDWVPLGGNPFDDMLKFVDDVLGELQTPWLNAHNSDYTLLRAEGVGYANDFSIVTSSPVIRTVQQGGAQGELETSGSWAAANISLRCGPQHQINGTGASKRNRGYLSVGPVPESQIDKYGHISSYCFGVMDALAQHLDNELIDIPLAATFTPIRIHEKYLTVGPLKTILWRTYSDVLGYTIQRRGAVRRSRMGEA